MEDSLLVVIVFLHLIGEAFRLLDRMQSMFSQKIDFSELAKN